MLYKGLLLKQFQKRDFAGRDFTGGVCEIQNLIEACYSKKNDHFGVSFSFRANLKYDTA